MMAFLKYNLNYLFYHFWEVIARILGLIIQVLRLLFSFVPSYPERIGLKDKLFSLLDDIELALNVFIYKIERRIFKLPHHIVKDGNSVRSEVKAAKVAALGIRGWRYAQKRRKQIYIHLAKHYKQFKRRD